MPFLHPLLQILGTVLGLYTLFLGWLRFQERRQGRKLDFDRRHLWPGKYACILWMAGLVLGQYVAAKLWGANGVLNPHYLLGQMLMLCVAALYVSGAVLERGQQKNRIYLPRFHGLLGVIAVLLALLLAATGAVDLLKIVSAPCFDQLCAAA